MTYDRFPKKYATLEKVCEKNRTGDNKKNQT